jgi:hypothetical protein
MMAMVNIMQKNKLIHGIRVQENDVFLDSGMQLDMSAGMMVM